jgi:hypothetical protein
MNHFKLVDPRSVPWFVYQFVNSPNWTFPYPLPVQDRKFSEIGKNGHFQTAKLKSQVPDPNPQQC